MKINKFVPPEWYLFCQALGDGTGYPKSENNQKQLGFSTDEMQKLHDDLIQNKNKELTTKEKQMILNCLDGAFDYVNTDIHPLYDIPEAELRKFKENLEKRWNMHSTYFETKPCK